MIEEMNLIIDEGIIQLLCLLAAILRFRREAISIFC